MVLKVREDFKVLKVQPVLREQQALTETTARMELKVLRDLLVMTV